jgi:hypothetical protein
MFVVSQEVGRLNVLTPTESSLSRNYACERGKLALANGPQFQSLVAVFGREPRPTVTH